MHMSSESSGEILTAKSKDWTVWVAQCFPETNIYKPGAFPHRTKRLFSQVTDMECRAISLLKLLYTAFEALILRSVTACKFTKGWSWPRRNFSEWAIPNNFICITKQARRHSGYKAKLSGEVWVWSQVLQDLTLGQAGVPYWQMRWLDGGFPCACFLSRSSSWF